MSSLRTLFFGRPILAVLLVAAAMLVRVLVPAGYMPGQGTRGITVMLCADSSAKSAHIVIPAGQSSDQHDQGSGSGHEPCAFGSLAFQSLGGADPVLLAELIEYIVALGFAATAPPVLQNFFRLKPPLRGPPTFS